MSKHNQAKFRALANMGDVLLKLNNIEEAVKVSWSRFLYYNENKSVCVFVCPSICPASTRPSFWYERKATKDSIFAILYK